MNLEITRKAFKIAPFSVLWSMVYFVPITMERFIKSAPGRTA